MAAIPCARACASAHSTRMSTTERPLDTVDLTERVKGMYRQVALRPERDFHFEIGRPLAERLGYPAADLDRIPDIPGARFGSGFRPRSCRATASEPVSSSPVELS